jgi:hypothetical protein
MRSALLPVQVSRERGIYPSLAGWDVTGSRLGRSRSRGVPEEIDEEPDDREDEDHDDPERLPACADVVPPEDTDGHQEPDEDPGDESGGGEEHAR